MKIIEKILAVLAITSLGFNFMANPGSSIILILSLSALSMFYLYFGFAFFNQIYLKSVFNNSKNEAPIASHYKLKAVVTGVIFSFSIIAILFKTMLWPISQVQLFVAVLLLSAWGLYYMYTYYHTKEIFYNFTLKRWLIIFPILLLFSSFSKTNLFEIKYRNYPTLIEAFKQVNEHPEDEALKKNLEAAWLKYEESKTAKSNEANSAE